MASKIPQPTAPGHKKANSNDDYITRIKPHPHSLKHAAGGLPANDDTHPIAQAQTQLGKQEEAPFTPCHTAMHSSRPSTELAGLERDGHDGGKGEPKTYAEALEDDWDTIDGEDHGTSLYNELAGQVDDSSELVTDSKKKPEAAITTPAAQASNELIEQVKRAGDKWGIHITFCAMDGNDNGHVGTWRPRFVPVCYLDEMEILVLLLWVIGVCFEMEGYSWVGIGFMGLAAVVVGLVDRSRL